MNSMNKSVLHMANRDKRIVISPEIYWDRPQIVQKMLETIAIDKTLFVGGESGFILAARDRSSKPNVRYDSMRFRTKVNNLIAMYHERWIQNFEGKKEFFYLDRAYLHF